MLLLCSVLMILAQSTVLSYNFIPRANMDVCSSLLEAPSLEFEKKLQDQTVAKGAEITLYCSVYGAPQGGITWYHRGRKVAYHPSPKLEHSVNGKRMGNSLIESNLRLGCVTEADSGEYECEARTPCGDSVTSHAKLTVEQNNRIVSCNRSMGELPYISMFTMQRVELAGNPVQLACRAQGIPPPQIQWEKLNDDDTTTPITGSALYTPLSNGDLIVHGNADMVTESFKCIASNFVGSVAAEANILYTEE